MIKNVIYKEYNKINKNGENTLFNKSKINKHSKNNLIL